MKTNHKYDTIKRVAKGALLTLLAAALSWAIVSFICWLIALCFGLECTLAYCTGIWLAMLLAGMVFGTTGVKSEFKF